MADSTMTLTELKLMAENRLDLDTNSDLTDLTVVIAANLYLKSYIPEEQKTFPSNSKLELTLPIGAAGLNIETFLPDIGGTKNSFRVWKGTEYTGNRMLEVREASGRSGYCVKEGVLHILPTPTQDADYVIQYMPKIHQFDISTLPDFDTTVVPIMVGAEEGAELMVASRYMERDQSEPQKAVNYRNDSLREIQGFFATHAGSSSFSM